MFIYFLSKYLQDKSFRQRTKYIKNANIIVWTKNLKTLCYTLNWWHWFLCFVKLFVRMSWTRYIFPIDILEFKFSIWKYLFLRDRENYFPKFWIVKSVTNMFCKFWKNFWLCPKWNQIYKIAIEKNNDIRTVQSESSTFTSVSFDQGFQIWAGWNWCKETSKVKCVSHLESLI